MRVIPVDKVKPGMVIERAVIDANGNILLSKGVNIDEHYIKRIKELGIPALYIKDDKLGKVEYDEVISERTRLEALKVTKDVMKTIRLSNEFDLKKVNRVVDDLITELMSSKDLMVALVDMRAANDSGFYHSVNTAVLSIITGLSMGYDAKQLGQLACGALFHDIGIVMLPPELLNKKSPLTPQENELILKHPEIGFEILRNKEGVSLISAHVALQHHEKYDGSGYPRGLAGEEISEFARIVSIAAIYDNIMGSGNAVSPIFPPQAIEHLSTYSGKWFDPRILEIFIRTIALFPIGSIVLLNTGELGLVVKTRKKFPTRPVVRVFKNSAGIYLNPPFEVDLAKNPEYFIRNILLDET